MPKKTYTTLSTDYAVCKHADCSMTATSLHQLAYPTLMGCQAILRLIKPRKCSKDETYSFYRDSKPVTYLRGLSNG